MTKSSPSLETVSTFLTGLRERADALNQQLARVEGQREAVAKALAAADARIAESGDEAKILSVVLELLHGMESAWQRNFQQTTEAIASEGLRQVFGGDLEVKIEPSRRADMSAIHFRLIKDGQEEDIMDGQGGGYINVIALLLRVLLILAARPLLRRLLVLDEPFAMVSLEFRHGLAEMLAALVDRLEFQAIIITQEREYIDVADVAHGFGIVRGAAQTELLKGAPSEAKSA